jgi:hypothetical protein
LSFIYRSCVGFQVPASEAGGADVDFGVLAPGCETRPEVIPRVTGRRRLTGWEVKMEEGSVRPGM